jgi:hypothetical protein
MAAKNHECFEPPVDVNLKVWRYMDFTKFVSLLDSGSLYLSAANRFEDPYEGAMSHANQLIDDFPPEFREVLSKFRHWGRSWTYINCWHMNEVESAAMWRLYSQTAEAVAIQSTYSKLRDCLPESTYIGTVKYIDYDNMPIPENNLFYPYVHKRLSFQHEKEVRVLLQELPHIPGEGFDRTRINSEAGKLIKLDLTRLVDEIYVSPTAPSWFLHLVVSICQRYDYALRVRQSDLSRSPIF